MRYHDAILKRPLLWAFAAVAGGIGVAMAWQVGILAASAWACVALTLLLTSVWRQAGVFLASLVVFFCMGMLAVGVQPEPLDLEFPCDDPSQRFLIQGDAPTERLTDPQTGRLLRRTEGHLLAQRCGEKWQPMKGRVRLSLVGQGSFARGDTLEVRLQVEALSKQRNTTSLDPELLARHRILDGQATALSHFAPTHLGQGWQTAMDRLRERTALGFEATLSRPNAALLKALTLADRGDIAPVQRDGWAASGIAHLLAISGLHVGLLALGVYGFMFALLFLPPGAAERFSLPRSAALLTVPFVLLFCLWVGAPASAVRATIMTVAVLLARVLGRPNSTLNALGLAGVGILLWSPTSIFDLGFLLSFTSVAALLLMPPLPPVLGAAEGHHSLWRRASHRLMNGLLKGLVASTVATLATVPMTAAAFGQVSWIAPLTNLIAVPLGAVVATPMALLAGFVAWFWPWLGALLMQLAGLAAGFLDGFAQSAGAFGAIDVPGFSVAESVLYYGVLLAPLMSIGRRRLIIMTAGFVLFSGLFGFRLSERFRSDTLQIIMPYVGQGDGMLVLFPGGKVMLVDGGGAIEENGWDPGRGAMAPLLRQMGVRSIDWLVISHPHPDHINGLDYLTKHFAVREIWYPGTGEVDSGHEVRTQTAILARVAAAGGALRIAADLPEEMHESGVRMQIIHPRPSAPEDSLPYYPEMHFNDNSIVLRLVYGERSILFTGDIEGDAEAQLAALLQPTDILKSPHHGSQTSSTAALLAALAPKLAMISCGHNNRFRFPSPQVLKRYAERQITTLRTDVHGTIHAKTDGKVWQVHTLSDGRWICDHQHCAESEL